MTQNLKINKGHASFNDSHISAPFDPDDEN